MSFMTFEDDIMKHVKAMQCLSASLMTRNEENDCGVNDTIKGKFHVSLMGKNYLTIP